MDRSDPDPQQPTTTTTTRRIAASEMGEKKQGSTGYTHIDMGERLYLYIYTSIYM